MTATEPSAAVPPLRVLFSLGSLGGGGAERRLVELLKYLDRSRIAPAVYLMEKRGELLNEVPADVPIYQWNIPGTKPSLPWRALGYFAPETARTWHLSAHLHRHPGDMVIGWMLQSAYEAIPATRQHQVPLVACTVLSPSADLVTAFGYDLHDGRGKAQELYRQAATIIANSADTRRMVLSMYQLPGHRVQVLPNMRDFAQIDRLAAEQAIWPVPARYQIVCAGRLHPQKGFLSIVAAIHRLREEGRTDIALTILGEGPLRDDLELEIAHTGVGDIVRLMGYVPNPYPYLRQADLFVLPSEYEGLPNVLIEALALGTPVIATDCPTGPREILEDGRWGKLIPLNASLSEAIADTLDDLPAARAQALQAAPVIRERHDIHVGVRRFEDLLIETARQYRQQRGPS